jgi:hypothetical protein
MRSIFLLLLLCTLTAGARPLEDRAATVKRYGANRAATALKPATEALHFKVGPIDLTCHLLKGVVIAEEYELHSLWTDDGIADLLAKNTGGSTWKEVENGFWRRADGKLVAVKTDGEIALIRPKPEGLEVLARHRPLTGTLRSLPALAAGSLYLRDETTLIRLDLGGR